MHVGINVHKEAISIAVADSTGKGWWRSPSGAAREIWWV